MVWVIYIEIILVTVYIQLQTKAMPFKLKLMKEFQKYLRETSQSQSKSEQAVVVHDNEQLSKTKSRPRKKLISKIYSIYQLILKRDIVPQCSIANFFNIIAINERAVRQQRGQESYLKTLFYIKNIKKVEIREKYILLSLSESPLSFPPIELTLERYRSFGDMKFYHMASLMVEAMGRLKAIEKLDIKTGLQDSSDFIEKYTQSLSNKTYVFRTANCKVVISKTLLELFQVEPEEFAIQCIKYRAPAFEPASTDKYYQVMVKYLENLSNLLNLICDRISLQAFLDNSIIRFRDTFYTKRNKKLYCKVKIGMTSPLVNIFEIQEIISKTDQLQFFNSTKNRRKHIEQAKESIYVSEIKTVRSLLKLPKNLLPQNINKVVTYQTPFQLSKASQNMHD